MTPAEPLTENLLTTPTEYAIVAMMPRRKTVEIDIPAELRKYQSRRAKETGKPFTQEMMAKEFGVPVKTLYHWLQTPGSIGARKPRGLTREMLLLKLKPNGTQNA